MRLWSIHPKYLDRKGLVALWREGFLAQKVLKGETRGYRGHPQLHRFKLQKNPITAIGRYLTIIHEESINRGYNFNQGKIDKSNSRTKIEVTSGQIDYERCHLLVKLQSRDPALFLKVRMVKKLDVHPIFRVVTGKIADWEVPK